jgi:cytochrome c oxidase subunit 4
MEQNKTREGFSIVGYRTYVFIWVILLLLLALNIAVSQILVKGIMLLLNIIIASCMALLDLVFFMNLRHEGKFLKLVVFMAIAVLTLIILFTFSDVWFRAG